MSQESLNQLAGLKAKWELQIESIEAEGRDAESHMQIKECMAKLSVYRGCVADIETVIERLKAE